MPRIGLFKGLGLLKNRLKVLYGLLLENGAFLVTEDGFYLVQE